MGEYIEREYMVKALSVFRDREHGDVKFLLGIQSEKEIAEKAPAADVEPVVHGRAYRIDYGDPCCEYGTCSVCGAYIPAWNYCPNCGAKMDKEE